MRKDNGDRKNFLKNKKRIKLSAYCDYEISGVNLDAFINRVVRSGITVINVKKWSNKRLTLSVNYVDRKILFAIAKELCYNIKRIRDFGRDTILVRLSKRVGLILGAIVFAVISITFNDLILSVDYSGSGSTLKREVQNYLENRGVSVMTRFSSLDLNRLEDEILAKNDGLSFVSCKKKGSRLIIELVLSDKGKDKLSGNCKQMIAECDGVIETLKVYRGTALLKEGDKISRGDVIVDGYVIVKEQKIEMNVLAYLSVLCQIDFRYVSERDDQEEIALEFAKNCYDDENVVNSKVKKQQIEDKFVYNCELTVKREYLVG